ncbi:MAG: cbb3-type cytochrome c oxidase subunit 3 [Xanthobacteraceae bacterium]
MNSTYLMLAQFAQSWGLAYFAAVFAAVVIYAMWPSRRQAFEDAARMPLRED